MENIKKPKHIGIIMDGNGRWATKRGLNRNAGHKEGAKSVREIITHARETNLQVLTLYAFSTENWSRPEAEVSGIMEMVGMYLSKETKTMVENGIRMKLIGDKSRFSKSLLKTINSSEEQTKSCSDMTLNIALNYGGRDELVNATKLIASKVKDGALNIDDITKELINEHLYTYPCPDCDLIIRTGGEQRVSNFLMWQGAYSEFYFTDVLWPDFNSEEFDKAVEYYSHRNRRFGGVINK